MGFSNRRNEELSQTLRDMIKDRQKELLPEEESLACSITSDCPPSHVCVNGKCVPLVPGSFTP